MPVGLEDKSKAGGSQGKHFRGRAAISPFTLQQNKIISKIPFPQAPGNFQPPKSLCFFPLLYATKICFIRRAVWKPEGQSAGQASLYRKPNPLSKGSHGARVLVQSSETVRNAPPGWGKLCLPGEPPRWDLSEQLPMVGCVLWQLPQHRWGLRGTLLMGSAQVSAAERKKDHSGEMAVLPDLWEFPCAFMAAHKMDHLS